MKFAQYLRDTHTPEWKRAYIDYGGLKKRITTIRRAQDGLDPQESPFASSISVATNGPRRSDVRSEDQHSEDPARSSFSDILPADIISEKEGTSGFNARRPSLSRRRLSTWSRRPSNAPQRIPSTRWSRGPSSNRASEPQSRAAGPPMEALPLRELLAHLAPQEVAFFAYLDSQLEKVESFFSAREKELLLRTQLLQDQLHELQDHRKLVYQDNDQTSSWTSTVTAALKLRLTSHSITEASRPKRRVNEDETQAAPAEGPAVAGSDDMWRSARSAAPSVHTSIEDREEVEADNIRRRGAGRRGLHLTSDPDDYLYAKKKLKKAVLEHYRGLELLHNYRILNLTGFRKALKKFEKVTKIKAQDQYMAEKVDKSALASDKTLRTMMKEMQELYAQVFFCGNVKRAVSRLRGGARTKTHHFSTFRSGFLIGVAVPALVSGIYSACSQKAHEEIRAWDALLFIYGLISVPVFFSMFLGLNVLVWARSRINYAFIFELDVRTRLDYREYFETPAFLFATFCYAFWLSFARIGSTHVSPTTWPLVWLGMTAGILFNPLPFLFRSSRFWLLRSVGKLFLSGTRRVEFTDFWLGDQLSSLIFTLSNLYMFGHAGHWPVAFVFASLPLSIRLIQSVKRYADSGLVTHLINGGKYGSGIINYLFYYLWRHQETHYHPLFALWLICNTVYSTYATSWDLLMDWSLLRPHAKHFFLRDELGYSDHIYLYYIAIVTNVMIRFAWILYIPEKGPSMLIRSFIVGFLEMLRRVQWNFYRLENEHLGNMDQYRVTREVPLPYAFDGGQHGDQDDDISGGSQTPP